MQGGLQAVHPLARHGVSSGPIFHTLASSQPVPGVESKQQNPSRQAEMMTLVMHGFRYSQSLIVQCERSMSIVQQISDVEVVSSSSSTS